MPGPVLVLGESRNDPNIYCVPKNRVSLGKEDAYTNIQTYKADSDTRLEDNTQKASGMLLGT